MSDLHDRIIQAADHAFRKGDDAVVAVAREALSYAKELIDDGLDVGTGKAYANGYCDANRAMRADLDDLLSSLGAQEQDQGAGLAAVGTDTGRSETETASGGAIVVVSQKER